MIRFIIAALFAAGIAIAQVPDFDAALGPDVRVTITGEDRGVVGAGVVQEDGLQLDLAEDYRGFAVVSFADPEGEIRHYDATVSADGTVVLVVDDLLIELSELLAQAGLSIDVSRLPATSEVFDTDQGVGVEVPGDPDDDGFDDDDRLDELEDELDEDDDAADDAMADDPDEDDDAVEDDDAAEDDLDDETRDEDDRDGEDDDDEDEGDDDREQDHADDPDDDGDDDDRDDD